jgi:catechol 2,3-dioxygenase-like lactoylglutathione lyase family enzyme
VGIPIVPAVTGVLETALYVADLARAAEFYESLFGFAKLDGDARFTALEVPGRQVLLLFRRGAGTEPVRLPGGVIPAHDGAGRLHLAFAVPEADLAAWEARLAARGIALEGRVRWPRGGTSIYFRDPDGHLVELATPGLWWPR